MDEQWRKEIRRRDEMHLLDRYFPGKSCGNTRCEDICRSACAVAVKMNIPPEELDDQLIQAKVIPVCGCEKILELRDYPNEGKPIPGCRFGYTYGSHPPKTDDQLEAQQKSSKTSSTPSRWDKIKGKVSNAIQALQIGAETAAAPTGTGEMVGVAKVGTELLTNLNLQAKFTEKMVGKLEEKTGETRLDLYFQIQDCISKQDFKRLLIIQGKLRRQLEELEKQGK